MNRFSNALRGGLRRIGPLRKSVGAIREGRFRREYRESLKGMARQREMPRRSGPIRVAFIAQYVPSWNKLEPVYRAMVADPGFEVALVCVPSGVKDSRLTELDGANDTLEYYQANGYEAIDALTGDGGWFDLRSFGPDYVFHSRPYNHFMPPEYSSSEISRYARVCSILYGICTWREALDTLINRSYFKDVSIFFAQCPSEKERFDALFAEGVRAGLQESVCAGMPVVDELQSGWSGGDGAWTEVRGDYRVLWTPRWSTDEKIGGSHFLDYKGIMLSLAARVEGMSLVIRPHPLMFANFEDRGLMSAGEIAEFKQSCAEAENVYLDERKDYLDTLVAADLLVTDISSIIVERYATGRPFVFCPPQNDVQYTAELAEMLEVAGIVRDGDELEAALVQCMERGVTKNVSGGRPPASILGVKAGESTTVITEKLLSTMGCEGGRAW